MEGSEHTPVVIAYDGSPAADEAIRKAGPLLGGRPALVIVVWKAGIGFELVTLPTAAVGLPPASLDVRTAAEVDMEMAERSQELARQGAGLAREAGFEAEGLAVADEPDVPVAETIVVGAHGHGGISAVILGSTSRDVIRHAPCPVLVARRPGGQTP